MIGSVALDYRRLSAELARPTARWKPRAGEGAGVDRRGPRGGAPSRRWLAFLPPAAFAVLAALLFVRLYAGDPAQAALGPDRPERAAARPARARRRGGPDRRRPASGPRQRGQRVRLVVRAVPDEHPNLMALASDEALKAKGVVVYGVAQKESPRTSAVSSARSATLTPKSASTGRARRHRLGRLRRAGDLRRPRRRDDRLQVRGSDHRRGARERGQAADPQGGGRARVLNAGRRAERRVVAISEPIPLLPRLCVRRTADWRDAVRARGVQRPIPTVVVDENAEPVDRLRLLSVWSGRARRHRDRRRPVRHARTAPADRDRLRGRGDAVAASPRRSRRGTPRASSRPR